MLDIVWKDRELLQALEGRRTAHCRFIDGSRGPRSGLGGPYLMFDLELSLIMQQLAIIVIPTRRESWLHKIAPEQISDFIAREEHGNTGERRRINYLPDTNRYADRFEEEDDETTPLSPETRRALEAGTTQVGTGLPGNVAMEAPATVATAEWARE